MYYFTISQTTGFMILPGNYKPHLIKWIKLTSNTNVERERERKKDIIEYRMKIAFELQSRK